MAGVLVTGASGFIGGHVAHRLAADGHRVVASGRDATRLAALQPAVANVVACDLGIDALDPLLQSVEVVVHCAALSSPWGRADAFQRANVMATQRLLEAVRRNGVRRFIHLGSPSIYFRFRDQYDLGEDFEPPPRWITAYARSKWESECMVRAASDTRLQTLILRPRAVFGEGDRAILPRLLAAAQRGWFPLIDGGRALIDVTHIDNLVSLVAHCIEADLPGNGRAYNVRNAEAVRVHALLKTLFDELLVNTRLVALPRAPALALATLAEGMAHLRLGRPEPKVTRYGVGVLGYSQTLDISRAQRELRYVPHMSTDAGIARFARWWTSHDRA